MIRIASLLTAALLLAGCASSSGFEGQRSARDCADESELMIRLGAANMPGIGIERTTDQLTILVDISNNMRRDVVVKSIRLEQTLLENAPYRFENGYRSFNQLIKEDSDHLFEVPTTGRGVRNRLTEGRRLWSDELAVAVTVSLEGGESYRCLFSMPAPR